jgi:hypothetical protein
MTDASNFQMKDSGERQSFSTGARRDTDDNKPRWSLLPIDPTERLVWVYTRGSKKYGDHNWQKGMPYSRYLDSHDRHMAAWRRGETDEDHLAQAAWNIFAIMWHQKHGPPGLDDVTPEPPRADPTGRSI